MTLEPWGSHSQLLFLVSSTPPASFATLDLPMGSEKAKALCLLDSFAFFFFFLMIIIFEKELTVTSGSLIAF